MKLRRIQYPRAEIPLAPMIDCVFLLLIYFIATVSLQIEESMISSQLPGVVQQEQALTFVDEQVILIHEDGSVWWNGSCYGNAKTGELTELRETLTALQDLSVANQSSGVVTLVPQDEVLQQWIVAVMDVVRAAGVKALFFGSQPGVESH